MWLIKQPFLCLFRFSLGLFLACYAISAGAWGPQGHRVAGTLTWAYLSEDARGRVQALLGDETLADASTWADRMRDNPSLFWQKQAGPYHYVTVPQGKNYAQVGAPDKGDGVTALRKFRAMLIDPKVSHANKQLALRFSLHIIQDLHQPMHVGNGRDRGGNAIKLELYGKSTNLHRVWDSAILTQAQRSDAAWVAQLENPDKSLKETWSDPQPEVWIGESARLRDQVYPSSRTIGEMYLSQWLPDAELRIQQSAVRCAAWLNAVLGPR
jgi:hypothetical protein